MIYDDRLGYVGYDLTPALVEIRDSAIPLLGRRTGPHTTEFRMTPGFMYRLVEPPLPPGGIIHPDWWRN